MTTPTVTRIRHLKGVGIFADIPVGQCPHAFKQFNLIYGFNGCGKTTLSRLFESISDSGLNPNLADGADFSFQLSDGSSPSSHAPQNAAARYLAVFNEDFIERSLTWKLGAAKPIIYLGQEQAELARKLTYLEAEETKLVPEQTLRAAEWSTAQRTVETHCRDTARLIAEELNLGRRYTATQIRPDFADETLGTNDKLEQEQRRVLKETIIRDQLPPKLSHYKPTNDGLALEDRIIDTLRATVSTIAIEALERRKDALDWVERGLVLHEEESECLFCGNEFSVQRKSALKEALSGGFEKLTDQIEATVADINGFVAESQRLHSQVSVAIETLPEQRSELQEARAGVAAHLELVIVKSNEWLARLSEKRANPDNEILLQPTLRDTGWGSVLDDKISELNRGVDRHNASIDNFAAEREEARRKLKRHHLFGALSRFQEGIAAEITAKTALGLLDTKIGEVRVQVAAVREQLRSHGPAAGQLNDLLKSYLGHSRISLGAVDDGYRICRNGRPSTKPLSEGEKTAVAFCYFLTSLNSEGRKIKDMIIVIDDPISSLDARAMTHVVSIVRRIFASPTQLLIMTHNLDFMREMKKWLGNKKENGLAEFLFIETGVHADGSRSSHLVEMPKLIRDYESEYHYLYSIVKGLAEDPKGFEKFAYLMPNAMRKVLDIFLAFKEPGASGLEPKVDKILQDNRNLDGERVKAMERLTQLESHSESIGDVTTFSAYTLEQVTDAAKCLLQLIEVVDPQHHLAMQRLCRA